MIELRVSDGNNNEPLLRWDKINVGGYRYLLFRRIVSGENSSNDFQSVSTFNIYDEELFYENIKVLNLHVNSSQTVEYVDVVGNSHTISESAILEKWILEPNEDSHLGYGLGRINIHSVSIDTFNKNYNNLLFDGNDIPNYDVICVGFGVNEKDETQVFNFSQESILAIEKAIKFGVGVLSSNKFISSILGCENGLGKLREYFGIKVGENNPNIEYPVDYKVEASFKDNRAYISKKGSVVSYPWNIGKLEHTFDISQVNTYSQFAFSDIWIKLSSPLITGIDNLNPELVRNGNFYLATNNNCAMIQLGDNIHIKDTEKKILANTLFHLKQITYNNKFYDVTKFENIPPMVPTITNQYIDLSDNSLYVEYKSEDMGVLCEYYIEGDSPYGDSLMRSNVVSFEYISNLECFMYKFISVKEDYNDYEWSETEDIKLEFKHLSPGQYKLMIKCRDFCGNESVGIELLAFIPKKSDIVSKRDLRHPNMQRLNHRYRGPHESYKARGVINQAKLNISELESIYKHLDKSSQSVVNKNNIDNVEIIILKKHIKDIIKYIKSKKFYNDCEQNS